MDRAQLIEIAKKIVDAETGITNEVLLEAKIWEIFDSYEISLPDMFEIDELVQDMLSGNFTENI